MLVVDSGEFFKHEEFLHLALFMTCVSSYDVSIDLTITADTKMRLALFVHRFVIICYRMTASWEFSADP